MNPPASAPDVLLQWTYSRRYGVRPVLIACMCTDGFLLDSRTACTVLYIQYSTVLYCSIHRGYSIRVRPTVSRQVAVCPAGTVRSSARLMTGSGPIMVWIRRIQVGVPRSNQRGWMRMDEVWCVPSRWVLDADAVPWTGCAGRTVQYVLYVSRVRYGVQSGTRQHSTSRQSLMASRSGYPVGTHGDLIKAPCRSRPAQVTGRC